MSKTCLKCGHFRQPNDIGPSYACPECGAVYDKVEAALARGPVRQVKREQPAAVTPIAPAPAEVARYESGVPAADIESDGATVKNMETQRPARSEPMSKFPVVFLLALLGWVTLLWVLPEGLNYFVGIVSGLLGALFYSRLAGKEKTSRVQQLLAEIASTNDWQPHDTFVGCDSLSAISIDDKQGKLCLLRFKTHKDAISGAEFVKAEITKRIVQYGDIVGAEIREDGVQVTNTSRGSQIVGAVVGNLLAGGVGAIVGGLSGKTETRKGRVGRLELRITIDDLEAPFHDVLFLGEEVETSSPFYKDALQDAQRWAAMLEIIIRRANGLQASPGAAG